MKYQAGHRSSCPVIYRESWRQRCRRCCQSPARATPSTYARAPRFPTAAGRCAAIPSRWWTSASPRHRRHRRRSSGALRAMAPPVQRNTLDARLFQPDDAQLWRRLPGRDGRSVGLRAAELHVRRRRRHHQRWPHRQPLVRAGLFQDRRPVSGGGIQRSSIKICSISVRASFRRV